MQVFIYFYKDKFIKQSKFANS